MADRVRQHEFRAAVEAFLAERHGRARYRSAQRRASSGRASDMNRRRPPEFVRRVARLLNPL